MGLGFEVYSVKGPALTKFLETGDFAESDQWQCLKRCSDGNANRSARSNLVEGTYIDAPVTKRSGKCVHRVKAKSKR